jgi:hypothetical protein
VGPVYGIGAVYGGGSFYGNFVVAKGSLASVNANLRTPQPASPVQGDADVSRCVVTASALVDDVLDCRNGSEVTRQVVQRVTVNVINHTPGRDGTVVTGKNQLVNLNPGVFAQQRSGWVTATVELPGVAKKTLAGEFIVKGGGPTADHPAPAALTRDGDEKGSFTILTGSHDAAFRKKVRCGQSRSGVSAPARLAHCTTFFRRRVAA